LRALVEQVKQLHIDLIYLAAQVFEAIIGHDVLRNLRVE
jgi:hypothetical protein